MPDKRKNQKKANTPPSETQAIFQYLSIYQEFCDWWLWYYYWFLMFYDYIIFNYYLINEVIL